MEIGGDVIMERIPIKRDFRAWGRLVEGSGHRWCFSQSHQWKNEPAGKMTGLAE